MKTFEGVHDLNSTASASDINVQGKTAQIIPFRFDTDNEVRVTVVNDEPWFVAADVCRILGQSNTTKALQSLDDDERSNFKLGRQGTVNTINESGLFTLILRCDDAIKKGSPAHSFRKWVTGEVLPSIRKHGRFEDVSEKMTTLLGETIGTDGFHMLGALVKGKVSALPAVVRRKATAKIWSQTHAAFGVRSAADIPATQLDSARNFIAAYALEGEWLPRQLQGLVLDQHAATNLASLCHHANWLLCKWQQELGPALRQLQSPLGREYHDHFVSAGCLARSLAQAPRLAG